MLVNFSIKAKTNSLLGRFKKKKKKKLITRSFTAYLAELLNNLFSVFKQHYTYFHTLFHPYVFQKTTNNITQTHLPNRP